MEPDSKQGQEAPRVIGGLASIAIVAGSMLGVGIFLAPGVVARQLHDPLAFLLVWVLGGVISLAGAVAYAELGTLFPKAGGDYVFLREAFGPSAAFASGWLLFVGVFCGSIAAMAAAVCQYQIPALLAPLVDVDLARPLARFGPLSFDGSRLCAVGLVALLTVANAAGTRLSARVQVLLWGVPMALLTVGATWAAFAGHRFGVDVPGPWAGADPAAAVTRSLLAVYFAYAGWNAVAYVGGEVRNPGRNIPLGLLGGTLGVTALYLLLCWGFVSVLGMDVLARTDEAGTATAGVLAGAAAQHTVTALIAVALLGAVNGTILGGARIAYAMAHDGGLPRALGTLRDRPKTPGRALWLQAALTALLIFSGTFEALLELTSIAMLAMGGLAVASLFVFRRRLPDAPRPYRALGYPILPGLYLAASLCIIVVRTYRVVVPEPGQPGPDTLQAWFPPLGLVVLGVTWIGHLLWSRRRSGNPGTV